MDTDIIRKKILHIPPLNHSKKHFVK